MTRHLATNGTRRAITLDLSGLQFIDSTGLRTILATQERCQTNGYQFSVVPGPASVQRLFEITKLLGVLPWKLDSDHGFEKIPADGHPTGHQTTSG